MVESYRPSTTKPGRKVLSKLREISSRRRSTPCTSTRTSYLDIAVLCSGPPDGTDLRRANTVLRNKLARPGELYAMAKRYMQRMTYVQGTAQSENVTLRKELLHDDRIIGEVSKRVAHQVSSYWARMNCSRCHERQKRTL